MEVKIFQFAEVQKDIHYFHKSIYNTVHILFGI